MNESIERWNQLTSTLNVFGDFTKDTQVGISRGPDGSLRDLRNLTPDDITGLNIAHPLSNICRYNGGVRRFYSVAEHSLLVERLLREETKIRDPRTLLFGLLHDAAEAYVGDVIRPVKLLLKDHWEAIEAPIRDLIYKVYGLGTTAGRPALQHAIHRADWLASCIEMRALYPGGKKLPIDWPIYCHGPKKARRLFLRRLNKLYKLAFEANQRDAQQPELPLPCE